jgi:putative heme-binding domain-containing protein
VIPEGPLTPQQQLGKFHLPAGFEIELVASEPDIYSPLSINFDKHGRLWVTDTFEYPFPPKGPGRDGLKVFEDTDRDGTYDAVHTYVDGLSMPTGAEPIPGGAIVFSVPSIFGCYDTDGDGAIDERRKLYTEFGNIDAHGMNNGFTRWLDGWIYACHGYANSSEVEGSDGHSISMNSGNGYRFQLDGSHIEHTWFGQVNPFGIAFDPLGNLFTADCHSKPAYCLLRGAYYPSFGKPHDGLGFGPQLINHSHGSTSISGIAYYAADHFPEAYRDCVFMGNSVTGRVNCDKVTAVGSSLVGTELPDFVTCDDRWFRPVEIKLGPDGALYIADFYDCIIGYYEVPLTHPRRDKTRGRIWRVVYRGTADRRGDAPYPVRDLARLNLRQLWQVLDDPNLAVRLPATHEIVDRFGPDAATQLRQWLFASSTGRQRAHGLWVLERLQALDDALVEQLAGDPERLVRVHLMKALAERAEWQLETARLVRSGLHDEDGFVRRAAADALGRHPEPDNVPALFSVWRDADPRDTYLIHTVRMAMRDQLADNAVFRVHVHHRGDADRTRRLLDVLMGLRTEAAAEFVFVALQHQGKEPRRLDELVHFVTRYAAPQLLDDITEYVLSWEHAEPAQQMRVFRSCGEALAERGTQLPAPLRSWAQRLAIRLLADANDARRIEGLQLVGSLRLASLYSSVARIAANRQSPAELRIPALQACVATGDPQCVGLFGSILSDLEETDGMRRAAALALALINSDEGRSTLQEQLQTAHYRLAIDIAASLAGSRDGAAVLLETIEQGKASPRLLRELAVMRRLETIEIAGLRKQVAKLTADLPPPDTMVAQEIAQRRQAYLTATPDVQAGRKVFEKQCAICHQLAGEGKKFGPDLDGIGVRGLDRLLEDLLDPSRNVDPAFRTTVILTMRGLTRTGLALRDEGNVLLLVDSEGEELRIRHDQIDQRHTSPLSPMPKALEKAMTDDEFDHLMGFLLSAVEPLKPEPDAPTVPVDE